MEIMKEDAVSLNVKRALNDLSLVYADMERAWCALELDELHIMAKAYEAHDEFKNRLSHILTSR